MPILVKSKQWLRENENKLTKSEYSLYDKISDNLSLLVLGAKEEKITEIAEALGYTIVHATIKGIDSLIQESWMYFINQDPSKKYMVIFDIDHADDRTFTALSSMIKQIEIDNTKEPRPFQSVVMCSDVNRDVVPAIRSVLGRVVWQD